MSLLNRIKSAFAHRKNGSDHDSPAPSSPLEPPFKQVDVDGSPTWALAANEKQNIDVMRRCCEAEEAGYWAQPFGQRICAAPFYFQRVAILSRKSKDYAAEVDICERWRVIIDDYMEQPMVKAGEAAFVHHGPRSIDILGRIERAKFLLIKHSQAATASAKELSDG